MAKPIQLLYHGTSLDNSKFIKEQGLIPKNYDKVYLTADLQVAYNYAKSKSDKTVICIVDAPQMIRDGFTFNHDNTHAEWTTDHVPPEYLVQVLIEDESELEALSMCVTNVS